MPFADAKLRFSNRVADYVRYRPTYPSALLPLLREECGLHPDHIIADIGSGTGLLSKLFLDHGNRVFGVEPNAEMRAAGEEFLRDCDKFTSVEGSAEITNLAGGAFDFVVAGQAFHWFEPLAARAEFHRILKRGGWVIILWQERRLEQAPFTRQYEDLLEQYGIDYHKVKEAYPAPEKIRVFLDPDSFAARDLPNHQDLDWEALAGRLRSSSFVPAENHPRFSPMMADLRKLLDAHQRNGSVRMEYIARVYFGHLDRT